MILKNDCLQLIFRKNVLEGGRVAGESCLPGWTVLDRIVPYYRNFRTYANINTVEAIRRNQYQPDEYTNRSLQRYGNTLSLTNILTFKGINIHHLNKYVIVRFYLSFCQSFVKSSHANCTRHNHHVSCMMLHDIY